MNIITLIVTVIILTTQSIYASAAEVVRDPIMDFVGTATRNPSTNKELLATMNRIFYNDANEQYGSMRDYQSALAHKPAAPAVEDSPKHKAQRSKKMQQVLDLKPETYAFSLGHLITSTFFDVTTLDGVEAMFHANQRPKKPTLQEEFLWQLYNPLLKDERKPLKDTIKEHIHALKNPKKKP